MYIDKILKRKDAASLIVAILLAMILAQLITPLTARLAQVLSGPKVSMASNGIGWQPRYLYPIINVTLQIMTLEGLIRLYVFIQQRLNRR